MVGWRLPATVAGPRYSPPDEAEEQCAEAPVLRRWVLQPGPATLASSQAWADGAHRLAVSRAPVEPVTQPQPQHRAGGPPQQSGAPSPQAVATPAEQIVRRPQPACVPGSLAWHPRAWPLWTGQSWGRPHGQQPRREMLRPGCHRHGCSREPFPPRLTQSSSSAFSFRSHRPPSTRQEWTCS